MIRITLWVILLLVDQPWLTDNSASIAGATHTWYEGYNGLDLLISQKLVCAHMSSSAWLLATVPHIDTNHLLFSQMPCLLLPMVASLTACHAALQMILGIKVEWQNAELIPDERHVLVSNHVTTGDLIALYQRPRRIVHLISTALPKRVAQVWMCTFHNRALAARYHSKLRGSI